MSRRPTVEEALRAAAAAAALGHPGAARRRDELLTYAAARGVRIRTLARVTGNAVESVHRWTGGRRLEREAILGDPCPTDLAPDPVASVIDGQTALAIADPLPL